MNSEELRNKIDDTSARIITAVVEEMGKDSDSPLALRISKATYGITEEVVEGLVGRVECEECERLFQPVTTSTVWCSECRFEFAENRIEELHEQTSKGTLPALRADCVEVLPIVDGVWRKGVEASPGATHEVWSVESPDYEGEDGFHHGDIAIPEVEELAKVKGEFAREKHLRSESETRALRKILVVETERDDMKKEASRLRELCSEQGTAGPTLSIQELLDAGVNAFGLKMFLESIESYLEMREPTITFEIGDKVVHVRKVK